MATTPSTVTVTWVSTEDFTVRTATNASGPAVDFLDLFGPSNPYFLMIHVTALVCLSVSVVVGVYTLVYLCRTGRGRVFQWKIGGAFLLVCGSCFTGTFTTGFSYCTERVTVRLHSGFSRPLVKKTSFDSTGTTLVGCMRTHFYNKKQCSRQLQCKVPSSTCFISIRS